ncbi:unnamed protein product [Allacma fusca]|uniref:Helicase ATP-binding domain-containing protein n=1 Tax=Allacma fusca TaxID=39272 RepID=A0A8J2JA76_9HEXA|nr:unnamed protein product [Allacma fusca]
MPKVAHYNAHNPEEEVQYVEEGRRLYDQAIPDHQVSVIQGKKRMHLRDEIFNKYDFKKRSIDVSKLTAYENKDKIINSIEGNRVVIIDGFTGCGKTTQVPQLIIDRAAELRNVIVTQPRKVAAVSVARRVCEERCWELGTVVGYQVDMDKRVSKEDTLVTYMTTGVLLRKLTGCKTFKEWTHIIVDEVHERDLDTDLLLLLIKKILIEDKLGKERNVKLILMSATIEDVFLDHLISSPLSMCKLRLCKFFARNNRNHA